MYEYIFLGLLALLLYFNIAVPYVNKKYQQKINKELKSFKEKFKTKWEKFGEPITKLPKKGWSEQMLYDLINKYSSIVKNIVKDKHLSGTIYSDSLRDNYKQSKTIHIETDDLFTKLKNVFTYGYEQSYLWNPLHSDEFGIGAFIDYQVVQMVGHMFGSDEDCKNISGFVTSGGTESLMNAVRSYRDWAKETFFFKQGQYVILASDMIHAAVLKSEQQLSDVKVVLVNSHDGKICLEDLQRKLYTYPNVIAVFVSAPCYPFGVIDPIERVAEMTKKYGCGLHVDCCLGGFVVNFLPLKKRYTNYLSIDGVTSISVDPHKNGFASKGASVLITKYIGNKPLSYYSIYSVPGWRGGIYGTPRDSGSQSCVNSLNTLLALLAVGQDNYEYFASEISIKTQQLANMIKKFDKLSLVVEPEVNVVTFKVDDCLGEGASYAYAYEMSKRGFVLNTLAGNIVHYCVTMRFVNDNEALFKFSKATNESIAELVRLKSNGMKFSGDAGMYCALENAMNPSTKKGVGTYIENMLFGKKAANDVVKSYFVAMLNPYN
jgi:glutamate/tyrosine decarboxylase-like PLP-dependent enzyme